MSSPVRRELEEFVAGRGTPERVVIAVTVAYYRNTLGAQREALRPLINVIDSASPGIVELGSMTGGRGFEVRLAERPFPREHEDALRRAAELVLRDANAAVTAEPRPEPAPAWVRIEPAPLEPPPPTAAPPPPPAPGLVGRILGAVRRLFSR